MTTLPPVTAEVAAAALDSLPTRLRKRADSAASKAANWPVATTDATVVVRVDDATTVTLTTTAGVVTSAEDAVCSCLLAPACLHRAAVLTLAPLAQETDGPEATTVVPSDAGASARAQDLQASTAVEIDQVQEGIPAATDPQETGAFQLTPPQSAAVGALQAAATAVLAAGVTGAGAVHRATLLHAAHSARVAGLHRVAAAAVRVARRLSEAGTGDPAFRLSELTSELAELLAVAGGLGRVPDPELIGIARRAYVANGSLRLHGLFTEPVVTASGYAGAVTYALAQDGRLRSLSDVAPGDADRARQAAGSAVPGGSALSLRELGDHGGAILTDPTVSPDGRIGVAERSVPYGRRGRVGTRNRSTPSGGVPLPTRCQPRCGGRRNPPMTGTRVVTCSFSPGRSPAGGSSWTAVPPCASWRRTSVPNSPTPRTSGSSREPTVCPCASWPGSHRTGRAVYAPSPRPGGAPKVTRSARTSACAASTAPTCPGPGRPSYPPPRHPRFPRNSTSCGGPWTARSRVGVPSPPPWPAANSPSARCSGSDHGGRVRAGAGGHRVGPPPRRAGPPAAGRPGRVRPRLARVVRLYRGRHSVPPHGRVGT